MKKLYVFMLSMLLLTVSAMGAILQVGPGQTYTTLQAAIAAAADGDVIQLADDIDMGSMNSGGALASFNANLSITIDLNGFELSGTDAVDINNTTGNFALLDVQTGTLTVTDNSISGDGSITCTALYDNTWNRLSTVLAVNNNAQFTLEGGTIVHTGGTSMSYGIDHYSGFSIINISGGKVKSDTYIGIRMGAFSTTDQSVLNVSGGIVEGYSRAVWVHQPDANQDKEVTINISGGRLEALNTDFGRAVGTSVFVNGSGVSVLDLTINISGGELVNNSPRPTIHFDEWNGAAITFAPNIVISAGTITNNAGTQYKNIGAANDFTLEETNFNISGGTFSYIPPVTNTTQNIGYGTIQAAIDAATAGDVIEVAAGTYNENLLINKSLVLQSVNGKEVTTIEGISGAGRLGTLQITNNTDGLVIGNPNKGFTIIGIDNNAPGIENAAIYFQGAHTNASIQYNEIQANGDNGLLAEYNAAVTHFLIDHNIFSGQTFLGANPAGDGFADQFTLSNVPRQLVTIGGGNTGTNTQHITFTNNTITGIAGGLNTLGNEQGNTLVTIDADNSVITGNTFAGTTARYGTSLRSRRLNTTISGNIFSAVNLTSSCGHIYLQNKALDAAFVGANTFDKGVYIESTAGGTLGLSIQGCIDAAPISSTITVLAGTYTEDVSVSKQLIITGAGSDATTGSIINGTINLGSGNSNTERTTLEGFRLVSQTSGTGNGITVGSFVSLTDVYSTGFNYGINLSNGQDLIMDGCAFNYNSSGLKIASQVSYADITISNSFFDNNAQHGWYSDASSSVEPTLDNIQITNTSFSNNPMKGFYTERLSNAIFDQLTVEGNGSSTYIWSAGIDFNLKWRDYQNITVSNSSFTSNATGATNGAAITAKGRADATSYNANPGTLTNFVFTGNILQNNERGLVIGEPAKTDAGVSDAVIHNNRFEGTTFECILNHHSPNTPDATCNWWGQATGPGTGQITGNVDYTPWLASNDISNPVCLGGAPNVFLDENFDNPVELFDANVNQRWYVDRYAPAAFESFNFNGENVLKIATGPGSANRGSQSSTFYNTHGRKFNQGGLGAVSLAGDLYIPADWASNHRRSGMWATMQDASGTITNYPILSFRNVDGTNPTFSYWTSATGWNDVSNTILYDNWNNFEYKLWNGIAYYYINGELVGTEADASSLEIQNVILQIYNFDDPALPANEQDPGSNYVAYWDNISTTTGGPVHNVTQNTYHTTIQSAIDAATAGDVIEVAAGTYEEQLHITTNNLTIRGDDKATTSILSPTNLTEYYNSGSNDNYPVVFIDGVAQCTIENFTIDGDGRGNANYRYQGIGFWNAGGTVDNVDVKGIMDTPFSGSQHGVAVYAYNNTPAINYTLTLSNMTIEDYQKNAMALNGSDNLTANLDNITTIGAGSTTVTAQNGIQFWGAQGSISNSSVTGNIWAGTSNWSSAGILLYQCQNVIDIENTMITNNFYGLDVNDAKGSITNSSITNTDADSKHALVIRNGNQSVIDFTMDDITINGNNNAGAYGIAIYCYDSDITSSIESSVIAAWEYGIVVYEMGLGEISHTTQTTKLTNNGVSMYSNAVNQQDASLNYWGAVEPDFNALISGDVEFCPYYTDELMTIESCPEVSNTTQGTTHYTLQDAVDDASTNDVIEITAGGTFDGIVLNTGESITLINSSGEEVIIRGASPALTVTSGTMTVAGITYTTSTDDPTILINGGNLVLRNCIIEESTGFTQSCIKIESGTLDAGLSADHGENTFITDGNAKAIINQTATTAEAIGNYWGTLVYNDIANLMTGPVNFDPWCNDDFSVCGYSTSTAGPVTTIEGTLEEAGTNPVIVPITVENFTDVDALSIRITYDPTTVTLEDVTSTTLPGYGGVLPGGLSAWYSTTSTSIIIGWIHPSATGLTLADGSVLFNLHFTFNNTTTGGTSTLEFDDSDDTYCEYQNALIQAPFADDPQANYWIDGWVSNLSVSFTRAYDPTVEISAVPAGGESPYAYNWAGPGTQTATTASITPTDGYGTYTVTVTDDLGAFVVGTYSYGPVHNIDTYLDYTTIQAAIDATETLDGHTIQVDAGSYAENVDVDKELSIIGDGATTTTISAGAGSGVDVSADNVTLEGFTISHSSVTGESDLGVKFLLSNSGTVQNCLLTSNSIGVMLYDAGDCDILDNEFAYNAVGIYLEGTTDGLGNYDGGNNGPFYSLSLNNTISGNNIHHSVLVGGKGGQGIYLDAACEGNTITSNTITLSEGPGYYAWKASGNTITNNTITSNGSEGVHLQGSSDNTITGNLLDLNATGIYMRSPAENVENNLISGNDITNNTVGILLEDDYSSKNWPGKLVNNTIQDNNISGNTNYGLQVLDVDASTFIDVDAVMNWWGDATGPAHSTNPCGTGDAVTDYVDYSPWYYQSGMTTLNGLPVVTLSDVPDITTIDSTPVIISVSADYTAEDLSNYDPDVRVDNLISADVAFPTTAEVISVTYNGTEVLPTAFSLSGLTNVYLSEILGAATGQPMAGHNTLTDAWEVTIAGMDLIATYSITMDAVSYILDRTSCNNELGTDDFSITYADVAFSYTPETPVCYLDPANVEFTETYPLVANNGGDRILNDSKWEFYTDAAMTSPFALPIGATITAGQVDGSGNFIWDRTSTLTTAVSQFYGSAVVTEQGDPSVYTNGQLIALERAAATNNWKAVLEGVPAGTYYVKVKNLAMLDPDGQQYQALTGPHGTFEEFVYNEQSFEVVVNACGLSGLLSYYNTQNSPLPGETIELWKDGASFASVSSDVNGDFFFPELNAGTYEIRPQTTLPVKSINATDAAQVNYWQVNAPSSYIEKVRFMAGDVNRIDATDLTPDVLGSFEAYRILSYFVTNGSQGWINAPAWSFWKANDQILANNWTDGRYPTVEVSDESVTQDVYGLITGDFNRSYIPTELKSASNSLFLNDGKNVLVDAGTPVSLPFTLQGRLEAGAFSVILEYPAHLVEVVGVNLANNPNAPILYTAENGVLRIAWMNPQPIYLNAGDALFTLELRTAENLGSNAVIRFSLAADPMNEVADGQSTVVEDVQLFADVLCNSFLGMEENEHSIGINIFPNPVREQATLVYHLPENGKVKLELTNALGQTVQLFCNEMQTSGTHSIQLNANHLNAGVYFVNITLETTTETLLNSRRLILQ